MMTETLPPELWWRVLRYVPSSSLCQMALVCKYFLQLTMDPGLWSHVRIRKKMIEREGLESLLENIRYERIEGHPLQFVITSMT